MILVFFPHLYSDIIILLFYDIAVVLGVVIGSEDVGRLLLRLVVRREDVVRLPGRGDRAVLENVVRVVRGGIHSVRGSGVRGVPSVPVRDVDDSTPSDRVVRLLLVCENVIRAVVVEDVVRHYSGPNTPKVLLGGGGSEEKPIARLFTKFLSSDKKKVARRESCNNFF